jgi:hypothetical protein
MRHIPGTFRFALRPFAASGMLRASMAELCAPAASNKYILNSNHYILKLVRKCVLVKSWPPGLQPLGSAAGVGLAVSRD